MFFFNLPLARVVFCFTAMIVLVGLSAPVLSQEDDPNLIIEELPSLDLDGQLNLALPLEANQPSRAGRNVAQSGLSFIDQTYENILLDYEAQQVLYKEPIALDELKPVLFTVWQFALLQEAKREFLTRDPTEQEVRQALTMDENETRSRGPREISLSGILFTSADQWIIWLNGLRITPEAIPEEIIDIKVNRNNVQLLWYDGFTDLIFPVKLRPHQRFNIDARLFLPGISPL